MSSAFDWRAAAQGLLNYVSAQTGSVAAEIEKSAHGDGAILIESAREDLENAHDLFRSLDCLQDSRDRDEAYRSLYYALRGTYHAAEQIIPARALYVADDAQAELMRHKRSANASTRRGLIRRIRDQLRTSGRWQDADGFKRLCPLINEELGKQDLRPISESTIRRACDGHS